MASKSLPPSSGGAFRCAAHPLNESNAALNSSPIATFHGAHFHRRQPRTCRRAKTRKRLTKVRAHAPL
eukprot:8596938-Pyramimonas_sp.AAC.1